MNRLPPFLYRLSPVGETLVSANEGHRHLQQEADARNRQLSVASADEGLSLWERDYTLSSGGSTDERRSRILTAMAGGQTLTPAHLASLATTVGKADIGTVEESFGDWSVLLSACYHNRLPENIAVLEATVAQLRPAHLRIRVQPVTALTHDAFRYHALTAGFFMEIPCRNAD